MDAMTNCTTQKDVEKLQEHVEELEEQLMLARRALIKGQFLQWLEEALQIVPGTVRNLCVEELIDSLQVKGLSFSFSRNQKGLILRQATRPHPLRLPPHPRRREPQYLTLRVFRHS